MDWRVPLFANATLHVKPRQSSCRACDCNSDPTRLLYRLTHGFKPGKRRWSWVLMLRRDCIVTLPILLGNLCNLILLRSRGQAGRKHIDFGFPPSYKKSASGTEHRETSGVHHAHPSQIQQLSQSIFSKHYTQIWPFLCKFESS